MKRIVVSGPSGHQRSVGVRFDESSMTNLGGLLGFKSFIDAQGLLEGVSSSRDGSRYSLRDVAENLIALRVAGIERLSHADDLAEDPLLDALLGERPTASTLFRRMASDGFALSRAFATVSDRSAQAVMAEHRGRHVIALDGTSLTVFGNQELATRGYNLERRGAKGYQPLIAASVTSRMVLGGVMRPGNASAAADADGLINDLALRLGSNVELLADAGFYGDRLLSQCEELGWTYVVAAAGRATLVRLAQEAAYSRVSEHVEIGEFIHQTRSMEGEVSVPRRYIVVRRSRERRDPHQRTLVDVTPREYFFYVTNLTSSASDVWCRYNRRSEIELVIRDLKESFALGCLPSSSFDANAAHLQLCLAAYNSLRLYAITVLDRDLARSWGQRLRATLIRLAARVVRGGRRILAAFAIATPLRRIVMPAFHRAARFAPA